MLDTFYHLIIIHTILHISTVLYSSPLQISSYTFHYIDTGIIHIIIKHFETFHKLHNPYCIVHPDTSCSLNQHSILSTGLDRYCNTCTLVPTLAYCKIPYCYFLRTSSSANVCYQCVYITCFNYCVIVPIFIVPLVISNDKIQ